MLLPISLAVIVSIALSLSYSIFELFDVEQCRDFERVVQGHCK